jgi:hypothetical protein
MAMGKAAKDSTSFSLTAKRGETANGICSNPFLEEAFQTIAFRIDVQVVSRDSWSYQEDAVLMVRGRPDPFHHTDRSLLTRIGDPTPNPLARG